MQTTRCGLLGSAHPISISQKVPPESVNCHHFEISRIRKSERWQLKDAVKLYVKLKKKLKDKIKTDNPATKAISLDGWSENQVQP